MIDTKELRRLAQEAMHPVTKGRWMRLFGERTVYDRMEDGCRGIPVVSTPVSPPRPFEAACLDFIAAANPAAVIELLDRLEAAEKERDNANAAAAGVALHAGAMQDRLEAAEADALEQSRLNGMGSEREVALMAKLEAAIAWEVCASIHREYGKGKDPFFNTRQGDFVKHANDARAMSVLATEAKP